VFRAWIAKIGLKLKQDVEKEKWKIFDSKYRKTDLARWAFLNPLGYWAMSQ